MKSLLVPSASLLFAIASMATLCMLYCLVSHCVLGAAPQYALRQLCCMALFRSNAADKLLTVMHQKTRGMQAVLAITALFHIHGQSAHPKLLLLSCRCNCCQAAFLPPPFPPSQSCLAIVAKNIRSVCVRACKCLLPAAASHRQFRQLRFSKRCCYRRSHLCRCWQRCWVQRLP